MIRFDKNVFLAAALLCGTIVISNCSSAPTTQKNSNTAVVTSNTNAVTATNVTKTEIVAAGDKTGVAECDEYIENYEACLTKIAAKVPQIEPAMRTAFEQQRKAFKDAAANPQSKAGLSSGCKQAIDTAKQSTGTYGCAW